VRIVVGGEALAARLRSVLAQHQLEAVAPSELLARLGRGDCDLVIVDGPEQCDAIRRAHRVLPLLAVTPTDDVAARVHALESGADDSLSVPFAPSQMMARVDALGRRAALVPDEPEQISADGLTLDLGAARATREGVVTALSGREVALLRWLIRHAGRAVPREELLVEVWNVAPGVETRSVDVAVNVLRKKIERDPAAPSLVVSVRGVGYAWGPSLALPCAVRRGRGPGGLT
jgi:DNA-binding response OmpR family regulator